MQKLIFTKVYSMHFLSILQRSLLIYQWQNIFEIMVISWILYTVIRLLAQDVQKPLLRYFCIYFSIIIIAYSYEYSTLQLLILVTAPALLTFFTIIHQETLQKNFVALYRPAISTKKDLWHSHLIQFCQKQANKNQSTAFIIEKKQNLESFLTIGVSCNSTFSPIFFDLLYSSPLVFTEQFLLLQYDGTLRGINTEIQPHTVLHTNISSDEKELFLSAKTDTLILKMDSATLTFTCIHNNKKLSHLSAHTTNTILNTFFEIKTHSLEGTMYADTFHPHHKKTESP